ncbi:MAG: helix-turn-helix transcriptional regulator [Lachnospiraceae bacterium]|nr:helix-turn-helix transcriptional regulator [Lachnospiraceae bacterium]
MNLEIANRLVALRKENSLSQEMLAEKLGISRQAVSKWERAEASPDTDNLIALAKLYHVSLDDLLKIHDDEEDETADSSDKKQMQIETAVSVESGEEATKKNAERGAGEDETDQQSRADDKEEDVHVGFDGIHVKDKDGSEVHVSWRGIHVHDQKNENEVHIDKNGIRVNGDDVKGHIFARGNEADLPLGIIAIVFYIIIGVCFELWHPGWLIFLLVPIISSLIDAVRRHNPNLFAYPVLAATVFLYVGLVHSIWHPAWVVFLTIPIYYSLAGYFVRTYTKDTDVEEKDR